MPVEIFSYSFAAGLSMIDSIEVLTCTRSRAVRFSCEPVQEFRHAMCDVSLRMAAERNGLDEFQFAENV